MHEFASPRGLAVLVTQVWLLVLLLPAASQLSRFAY